MLLASSRSNVALVSLLFAALLVALPVGCDDTSEPADTGTPADTSVPGCPDAGACFAPPGCFAEAGEGCSCDVVCPSADGGTDGGTDAGTDGGTDAGTMDSGS